MEYNSDIHQRRSIRLKDYDYSQMGLYFITICTQNRLFLFGEIVGSIVRGVKIGITKWFHNNTDIRMVWQRNYYDHIIRNGKSYHRIVEYIQSNPLKWKDDKFNI